MNSLKLLIPTFLLFLTFGAVAADAPQFSDNPTPIFENTYLIDNLGNNSRGADLTLRVHKNAPFGDCNNKIDCPPSLIVSGTTGNVNMPVDVNVRSLHVGKNAVIDSTGKWVGSPAGLVGPVGPQGPKGDVGAVGPQGPQGLKGDIGATGPQGPQGLKGDTGAVGPQGPQGMKGDTGPQGPQGLKGDTGATGPQGPQGLKGDNGAAGPGGPQGIKGDAGPIGPQGPQGVKGDTGPAGPQGLKGDTGPQGPQGDGCWYDDRSKRINCGGGTWIEISSLKGPKGDTGATGATGPSGPRGFTGDTGLTGAQGPKGADGKSCRLWEASTTTYIICGEGDGPEDLFDLGRLKGAKGDPGVPGTVGSCRIATGKTTGLGEIRAVARCAATEMVTGGGCEKVSGTLQGFTPFAGNANVTPFYQCDASGNTASSQVIATAICCAK